MASPFQKFNCFVEDLAEGIHDLDTHSNFWNGEAMYVSSGRKKPPGGAVCSGGCYY